MKFCKEAVEHLGAKRYIHVDERPLHPTGANVTFQMQSGPTEEVGVDGCQVTDVIDFAKAYIEAMQEAFPCEQNRITIQKLREALSWQEDRKRDRTRRKVIGQNRL